MNNSISFSPEGKERLYEEAKQLFLQGKHDEAVERFSRIYEKDVLFRDVVDIVNDYYDIPRHEWLAKYQTRFVGGGHA